MPQNTFDDRSTLIRIKAFCKKPLPDKQAIAWSNVEPDLCHHMASLSYNDRFDTIDISVVGYKLVVSPVRDQ